MGYTPSELESDTLVLDTVLWFDESDLDTDPFYNNSDRIYCQSAFYEEISWSDEQAAALATKLYWVSSIFAGKGGLDPKRGTASLQDTQRYFRVFKVWMTYKRMKTKLAFWDGSGTNKASPYSAIRNWLR